MANFRDFLKICKQKLSGEGGYWANQRSDLQVVEIYRAIMKYGYL